MKFRNFDLLIVEVGLDRSPWNYAAHTARKRHTRDAEFDHPQSAFLWGVNDNKEDLFLEDNGFLDEVFGMEWEIVC